MDSVIYCRMCGEKNSENSYKCTRCGVELHLPVRPATVALDNTMGGLIPYKNAAALWSYYLGVFSFIPVLGIPLGIAAVMTGLRGLSFVKQNPAVQGRVHAWIGLVLGGLFTAGNILLVLLIVKNLSGN
jgi:hypothetical protein